MQRYRALVLSVFCFAALGGIGSARTAPPRLRPPVIVPAGTLISVHVLAPLVSNVAQTGQAFAFETTSDVVVNGLIVVRKGVEGSGTVAFAGAAGGHGHEGNLHLVFAQLPSTLGAPFMLNTESDFSGHRQRALGFVAGATWFTGFGAAVRGGQAVVAVEQPIPLTLARPVCIASAKSMPCPVMQLTPAASTTSAASETSPAP